MEVLNNICNMLREKDNFLITSHVRPDGDCIGSELAVALILQKLRKKFTIINSDRPDDKFDFLPLFPLIKNYWQEDEHFSVSIILDCGKWSRIGDVATIAIKSDFSINIDHHKDSVGIGTLNYIDPLSSSTGEIIFSLLNHIGVELNKDIATTLYTAILTDTGRFRYSNTSPKTHRAVASLLETGISPEIIVNKILSQESPATLELYSEIYSTLKTDMCNKIAWYSVTREVENKFLIHSASIESDRLFDELRTLKNFQVFLLFTEMDGKIRTSFRTNSELDLSPVARFFGGGGHPQACSCIIDGCLLEVQEQVLEKINSHL